MPRLIAGLCAFALAASGYASPATATVVQSFDESGVAPAYVQKIARCLVAKQSGRRIDSFLAIDPYSLAAAKAGQRLLLDTCFEGGAAAFQPVLLRSALYDAKYHRDFGKVAPSHLADRPAIEPENEVVNADAGVTGAFVLTRTYGDCVGRSAPDAVRTFILSDADTDAEAAALKLLQKPLSDCINPGGQLRFSRTMLRGVLAEALYKLASDKRPPVSITASASPAPGRPGPVNQADLGRPGSIDASIAPRPATVPSDADIDDIVVTAQPGPPIWHVTQGNSDVVIVGTVAPLPRALSWSRARLTAGIVGARRILISPEPSSGLVWNENFTSRKIQSLRLPPGQTIRAALPPEQLVRYDAALRLGGIKLTEYDHWNAGIVGFVVLDHGRRASGLTTSEPGATVREIAQRKHVHAAYISPRAGLPTLDSIPGLTMADQTRCLGESLDDLDRERAAAAGVARAWAVGDLAYLRAHYEPPHACEDLLTGDAVRRERATEDMVSELRHDLTLRGRTVALVDVSVLLKPGLFGELEKAGAVVRSPSE